MGSKDELSINEVAQEFNLNKRTVQKYLLDLSKEGKLQQIRKGRLVYYQNPKIYNSNLPHGSSPNADNAQSSMIKYRFHKNTFVAKVPLAPKGFWNRIKKKPWITYKWGKHKDQPFYQRDQPFGDWGVCFQVFPSRHDWATILLFVSEVEVTDPKQGEFLILSRVLEAFSWFIERYNVKLHPVSFELEKTQQHVAVLGDEFSKFAHAQKMFYLDDVLSFDASKGVPEADFVDEKHAVSDSEFFGLTASQMISKRINPAERIPALELILSEVTGKTVELAQLQNYNLDILLSQLKMNNAGHKPKSSKEQKNIADPRRYC